MVPDKNYTTIRSGLIANLWPRIFSGYSTLSDTSTPLVNSLAYSQDAYYVLSPQSSSLHHPLPPNSPLKSLSYISQRNIDVIRGKPFQLAASVESFHKLSCVYTHVSYTFTLLTHLSPPPPKKGSLSCMHHLAFYLTSDSAEWSLK